MLEDNSKVSSSLNDEIKQKLDALINGMNESNINLENRLTKEQIKQFLDGRKMNGREFDPVLLNKLFEHLNLNDENPTINADEFAKLYINFESEINKQANDFNNKFRNEKEEYNRLNDECRKYQQEKVNKEGFCENAKVTVIIEDVDIKSKIEGIQSISIKLIYNNEERETEFISGDDNHQINQKFEL